MERKKLSAYGSPLIKMSFYFINVLGIYVEAIIILLWAHIDLNLLY